MSQNKSSGPDLFSPEGVVVLTVAFLLDVAGLINLILDFFGIGLATSFVLDIVGFISIGGWMLIRRGTLGGSKRAAKRIAKRLGLTTTGELIPVLGDFAFCWTYSVYLELRE